EQHPRGAFEIEPARAPIAAGFSALLAIVVRCDGSKSLSAKGKALKSRTDSLCALPLARTKETTDGTPSGNSNLADHNSVSLDVRQRKVVVPRINFGTRPELRQTVSDHDYRRRHLVRCGANRAGLGGVQVSRQRRQATGNLLAREQSAGGCLDGGDCDHLHQPRRHGPESLGFAATD